MRFSIIVDWWDSWGRILSINRSGLRRDTQARYIVDGERQVRPRYHGTATCRLRSSRNRGSVATTVCAQVRIPGGLVRPVPPEKLAPSWPRFGSKNGLASHSRGLPSTTITFPVVTAPRAFRVLAIPLLTLIRHRHHRRCQWRKQWSYVGKKT